MYYNIFIIIHQYPISFNSPNLEQEIRKSVEQYWEDYEHMTDNKIREEEQQAMVKMLQFVILALKT
ncbi:MAG: hypothetical protein WA364_27500 [Candidatus Nitrosopolaris sp.]